MDSYNLLIACFAAFFAGGLNSIAGGGTFITLPTLLATGITPVMANTTSAAVLLPGYLGSVIGFRKILSLLSKKNILGLILLTALFSAVGAIFLVNSTDEFFMKLIPFLILIATFLFATNVVDSKNLKKSKSIFSKVLIGFISTYGGYFNGGLGIALLSALSFDNEHSLKEMSAIKSLLSFVITLVSVTVFISNQFIVWSYVFYMIIFSIAGGYLGAKFIQSINEIFIKYFVITIGLSLSSILFYLQYLG